jgi:hypothetical protein
MQKAAITIPNLFSSRFASSDEVLPYRIIYLTFQDSRNVPNTIIEFSDSPYYFVLVILKIVKQVFKTYPEKIQ